MDICLGDGTDAAVDDVELNFISDVELKQSIFQGLDGTGVVTLKDEVQAAGLLKDLVQILKGDTLAGACCQGVTTPCVTTIRNLAGSAIVLDNEEVIASSRNTGESLNLHRHRWTSIGDVIATFIGHTTDTTMRVTHDDRVTHVQRTALDDDGGHRSTSTVKVGFDGNTLSIHVRVSHQLERCIRGQQNCFKQLVDVLALLRRDIHEHGVPTPFFGGETIFGQLATDLLRVRTFFINLVDSDDDRDVGGFRVIDCLYGLGHNTVVGSDHQDGDICGLSTTSTHGGERLVTRGIQEGHQAVLAIQVNLHLVGTDVLGDAAGLTRCHIGFTDRVQQTSLTVVNVTHDGNHRRTLGQILCATFVLTELEVEGFEELTVFIFR